MESNGGKNGARVQVDGKVQITLENDGSQGGGNGVEEKFFDDMYGKETVCVFAGVAFEAGFGRVVGSGIAGGGIINGVNPGILKVALGVVCVYFCLRPGNRRKEQVEVASTRVECDEHLLERRDKKFD